MNVLSIFIGFYIIKGNYILFKKPEFTVRETREYTILSFKEGTETFSQPGEPDIPWKIFKIPLEPDEEAEIDFKILKTINVEIKKPVIPFPHYNDDGINPVYIINSEKYRSFPENNIKNLGTGGIRGRKCLLIAYTPFIIKNGQVFIIEEAELKIEKRKKGEKGGYKNLKDYVIFNKLLEGNSNPYIPILNSNLEFFERDFWIKIIIKEEGIYRITYNDLKNLGIEPSLYPVNEFGLFSLCGDTLSTSRDSIDDLNPLPFTVPFIFKDIEKNGYFNENDTLIFYSTGPSRRTWLGDKFSYYENPFSNEVVYWLALEGGGGVLMDTVSGYPGVWEKERDYCISYYRHEKNLINLGKRGLRWEGEDLSRRSFSPEEKNFDFNLGYVKKGDGRLTSEFVILDNSINKDNVYIKVLFNGDSIFASSYLPPSYNSLRTFTSPLHNISVTNNYKMIIGMQGDTADYLYLDYFEVEYTRELNAKEAIHMYDTTLGMVLYKIQSDKKGYLLDVTDYKNPLIFVNFTFKNDTLKFVSKNTTPKQFYYTKNTRKPYDIILVSSLKTLRDTLNQADYLIITHKDLVSALMNYINYRKNKLYIGDSLISNANIKIVTVDKIYEEFGFGSPDFTAIRNFLAYTFFFWKEPKPLYVLLAGDGNYDYKNYSGSGKNYIPPTEWGEAFDPDAPGQFTYDIFYVQFDPSPNDPPDMLIGRIPAKSSGELLIEMEKIKEYEMEEINSTWRNRILGVADDNRENGLTFTRQVKNFFEDLPPNIDFEPIYTVFYPYDQVSGTRPLSREKFYNEINQKGYFLAFLWGHGNPYQIFHEKIIAVPGDIPLLNIEYKRPFFFFGACKPSAFDRLEICVGEALMMGSKTGIATLGPSSLIGFGYESVLRAIMNVLYDYKKHTLGEIYIQAGVPERYVLLGDPSLLFYLPEPSIDLSYQKNFIDTLMKGGIGEFVDTIINKEGKIKVELFAEPRIKFDTTAPPTVETCRVYIRPNNIFKGYFSLNNGIYHPLFPIPRFLNPKDTLGRLIVYYPGEGRGLVGYADSIYFKEFDGSVIDTSPPSIRIIYRGKEIKDSTKIIKGSEIEIEMEDENGILIYGNEKIRITIANNTYDITDLYIAEKDNPKKGKIKWKIPENINPGYHTLTTSCYDNFGNSSFKSVIIFLEEKEKGYVKILPFPNPSKDKIFFGIETNLGGKIKIKIYTLRGRLIFEKIDYINEGFNKIIWDGKDKEGNCVANGIYLYLAEFESFDKNFKKSFKGKIAILK